VKDIIVCIDGTSNATEGAPALPSPSSLVKLRRKIKNWFSKKSTTRVVPDRQLPSNVLLFVRALAKRDALNAPQIVEYIRGVGTDDSATGLGRIRASMKGTGLSQIVQDAYGFLTNNCERDDHVYILGFSRGAAAARSLSGLTELFGVLPPSLMDRFPDAWDYYNTSPDDRKLDLLCCQSPELGAIAEEGDRLRRDHESECAAWSREPIGRLAEYPHAPIFRNSSETGSLRAGFPDTQYVPLPLHFVGVWDTVFEAEGEGFHEGRLAWNVGTAYQALAVHEVRANFQPVLWETSCRHQEVIQTWFTGAHSDIGGGNGNIALSSITLEWMIRRARESCRVHRGPQLEFNAAFLAAVSKPDIFVPISYPQNDLLWRAVAHKYPPGTRQIGMTEHRWLGRTKHRPPLEFRHLSIEERVPGRPDYCSEWNTILSRADEMSEQSLLPEEDGNIIALLMHLQNCGVTDPDVDLQLAYLLCDVNGMDTAVNAGAREDVTVDEIIARYIRYL